STTLTRSRTASARSVCCEPCDGCAELITFSIALLIVDLLLCFPELLDARQHALVRVISAELRARAGELRAVCAAHLAVLIHQGVGQTCRPLTSIRSDRDTVLLGHLDKRVEVNRARVLEGLVHTVSEELPPSGLVELVHAELGEVGLLRS